MRRLFTIVAGLLVAATSLPSAQQSSSGAYRVVKAAKVGGEGGWDYLFADVIGRRLYIPAWAVRSR